MSILASLDRKRRQGGYILLLFTLSLLMIVPLLGLTIDAAYLYMVRVKLQAAADAAALAAARALNSNASLSQQSIDASNSATAFFNGNFPTGYLNATGSNVTTTMAYGSTTSTLNTVYVTVAAHTNAPTYFMRWFNYNTIPIAATGTSSRRDINIIMVIDRSGSMNTVQPGGQTACAIMKVAASNFIDNFSNNRDTIGMVSFNGGNTLDFAPSTTFNPGLKATVNAISCGGDTGTAGGLNRAYTQLVNLNNPGKLNAIVLFTDGQAEAITADYPVKMVADTRYGDSVSPFLLSARCMRCPPARVRTPLAVCTVSRGGIHSP